MTAKFVTSNDMMTLQEVAASLGKTRRAVERLVADGRLTRYRNEIDRRIVYIKRAEVERLMLLRRVGD